MHSLHMMHINQHVTYQTMPHTLYSNTTQLICNYIYTLRIHCVCVMYIHIHFIQWRWHTPKPINVIYMQCSPLYIHITHTLRLCGVYTYTLHIVAMAYTETHNWHIHAMLTIEAVAVTRHSYVQPTMTGKPTQLSHASRRNYLGQADATITGTPTQLSRASRRNYHRQADATITGKPTQRSWANQRNYHGQTNATITGKPTQRSRASQRHYHGQTNATITGKPTQLSRANQRNYHGQANALPLCSHAVLHGGADPHDHGRHRQHPLDECDCTRRSRQAHLDRLPHLQGWRNHGRPEGEVRADDTHPRHCVQG
jgi:hypothetical protein